VPRQLHARRLNNHSEERAPRGGRGGGGGCGAPWVRPTASQEGPHRLQSPSREAGRRRTRHAGQRCAAVRDLQQPARPFPSSIFLDKNRRDIGKSQPIWTDSNMETAGSQLVQTTPRRRTPPCAAAATAEPCRAIGGLRSLALAAVMLECLQREALGQHHCDSELAGRVDLRHHRPASIHPNAPPAQRLSGNRCRGRMCGGRDS
jgi:hypothetical protein